MAYISYEDIPSRVIGYRVIPRLKKFYRADGTYDLFNDVHLLQPMRIHYLVNRGQAGIRMSHNHDGTDYGTYVITGNKSTFNELIMSAGYSSGSNWNNNYICGFKLALNNDLSMFPKWVYLEHKSSNLSANSVNSEQNSHHLWYVTKDGKKVMLNEASHCNGNIGWEFIQDRQAKDVLDWKDVEYVQGYAKARDDSKYTSTWCHITLQCIHRYPEGSEIHRYYN